MSLPTDINRLKLSSELAVARNTSSVESVHYLAVWHLERQSYQHVNDILNR